MFLIKKKKNKNKTYIFDTRKLIYIIEDENKINMSV